MYPLVSELAADGIPVAVTCRVLKLARQPYYRWLAARSPTPSSTRRTGRTRCSTPTATTRSSATGSSPTRPATPGSRWPSGPRGGSARTTAGGARSARRSRGKNGKAGPPVHDDLVQPELHRRRHRTGCGSPTSPSTAPARASSTCARSRTCSPTGSSATRIDSRMKSRLAVAALAQRRRPPRRRRRLHRCTPTADRSSAAGSSSAPCTATAWSARWAESAPPATTPPWNRSSRCCRRTSSTAARWDTREELRIAIVTWIERTYHRRRRQAALGRLTPIEFETIMTTPATQAA